jgi:alpha-mannosidase/mannosylglycerate hydrolase
VTGVAPKVTDVRVFNPTEESIPVRLMFEQAVQLERVTLAGDVMGRLDSEFWMRPKELMTIRVTSEEK